MPFSHEFYSCRRRHLHGHGHPLTSRDVDGAYRRRSQGPIEMTISVPEEHDIIPKQKSEYIHGARQLIPGLENALTGMHAGEMKRVELDAAHAFGPYDAGKKTSVPRSQLPEKIRVGDITTTTEGTPFTVIALSDGSGCH